jgi:hypothetical protein
VTLDFFARLGSEVSLYGDCERVTFPDDFLVLGLICLTGYFLSTFLKKEKAMKEKIKAWLGAHKVGAICFVAGMFFGFILSVVGIAAK